MDFNWDEANVSHIARHDVSTEETEQVIANDPLDLERQIVRGEERFVHLGETDSGRVLFVITTMRGKQIRVVTAFPADRQTRAFYAHKREDSHGKSDQEPGDP